MTLVVCTTRANIKGNKALVLKDESCDELWINWWRSALKPLARGIVTAIGLNTSNGYSRQTEMIKISP